MSFIVLLETLCKEKGITISRMLSDLGLSHGIFSNWKTRGTIPNGDILKKIANYFGVSVDYLLGNDTVNISGEPLTEFQKEMLSELKGVSSDGAEKIRDYVRLVKKADNGE